MQDTWVLPAFALLLLAYAAFSAKLADSPLSPAIVFTAVGVLLGPLVLSIANVRLEVESIKLLAEVTLSIALFTDAARINLLSLERQLSLPGRLLGVGLPLTIALGMGVAVLVFPNMLLVEAALVAIILAPTDAALGQKVVTDPSVPASVRQGLNVESGLNDGIAVPFYLLALEIAKAELTGRPVMEFLGLAAEQIGLGLVAGLIGGAIGGAVIRWADSRGDVEAGWRQLVMFAAAALAYGLGLSLGGSVFIATFTGGVAFAAVSKRSSLQLAHFSEQAGAVLSAMTFTAFGLVGVAYFLPKVTWPIIAYALLSLTVIRMGPVALALLGTGTKLPTVGFIGWFGPRGLASIVFGLGLVEFGLVHSAEVLTVIFTTVLLSIVAHGLSAPPLTKRYSAWYDSFSEKPAAEGKQVVAGRTRLGIDP
ncbi:MAG: sodium:proton antiporter [Coriobacteriia bacterium]|nr:sodium:proton antiporter [Coriobacteriia bacterium]